MLADGHELRVPGLIVFLDGDPIFRTIPASGSSQWVRVVRSPSKHKEGFDPLTGLLCVNPTGFGMEPARRFAPWS
jgi:hypothetical protein